MTSSRSKKRQIGDMAADERVGHLARKVGNAHIAAGGVRREIVVVNLGPGLPSKCFRSPRNWGSLRATRRA